MKQPLFRTMDGHMESALHMPATTHTFLVAIEGEPMRIDKFIAAQFPDFSRTYFQQLITDHLVTVNGTIVHKPSMIVRSEDRIEVHVPESVVRTVISCTIDLGIQILFTHEHFYIMFKPAGVLMHPTSEQCTEFTMIDWLVTKFPELRSIGPSDRPALVHRLDRETSGLMIVPRSNRAHQIFNGLFKSRGMHKTYLALVQGHPEKSGVIDLPIGRNPFHRKKMAVFPEQAKYTASVSELQKERNQKSRHAITHYKVLEYFQDSALVELKPVTGRTHQIRVHMTAIGYPLLADKLYGKPSGLIDRHALHAAALSFEFDGQLYEFKSELPTDFQKALTILQKEI